MALRTFIGSCATLTSSVVNLTVLMILKGEPGWICLMCCNADSKLHQSAPNACCSPCANASCPQSCSQSSFSTGSQASINPPPTASMPASRTVTTALEILPTDLLRMGQPRRRMARYLMAILEAKGGRTAYGGTHIVLFRTRLDGTRKPPLRHSAVLETINLIPGILLWIVSLFGPSVS